MESGVVFLDARGNEFELVERVGGFFFGDGQQYVRQVVLQGTTGGGRGRGGAQEGFGVFERFERLHFKIFLDLEGGESGARAEQSSRWVGWGVGGSSTT